MPNQLELKLVDLNPYEQMLIDQSRQLRAVLNETNVLYDLSRVSDYEFAAKRIG